MGKLHLWFRSGDTGPLKTFGMREGDEGWEEGVERAKVDGERSAGFMEQLGRE